jgi:hypothetical protein
MHITKHRAAALAATLCLLAATSAAEEKPMVFKNVNTLIGSDLTWSKDWVEERPHPTKSKGMQRIQGMKGWHRIPVKYDCERLQSAVLSLQRGEKHWHQGQAWVVWTDVATDVNKEGDKRRGKPEFTYRAYRGYFSVHTTKDKNVMVLRLAMVKHFDSRHTDKDGIVWAEQKFTPCGIDLEFSIEDDDSFPEGPTLSVRTEGFHCDSSGKELVRKHEAETIREMIAGGAAMKAKVDFVKPGATIKTVSKDALAKLFKGDKQLSTNPLLGEPFSGDLPAGFRERPVNE